MTKFPKNFGRMSEPPVAFADRLSALCAAELCLARSDPERVAEMIERLTNSLAFTVAIATGGDPKRMDNMLKGIESHLYTMATDHAKVGAMLG